MIISGWIMYMIMEIRRNILKDGQGQQVFFKPLVQVKKKAENKIHNQGQEDIHTVMALQVKVMEDQPFPCHGQKRCQKQRAIFEKFRAFKGKLPAKNKKQGNIKEAVAGVCTNGKDTVVYYFRRGHLDGQSIVAVPHEAENIKEGGDDQDASLGTYF